MYSSASRSLTQADRVEVFRLATRSFIYWHADQIEAGMTDDELETALKNALGTFGGSGGPDRLSVCHTGAGLRIWGGWHIVNHCVEKPLFKGTETVVMAREVYGIANPDDNQLALF